MGEKIDFPKNYQIYLNKAEKELKQNNLPQAMKAIESAYEIDRTMEANLLYVSILIQAEQYGEAYDRTVDFEELYLNNPSYTSVFLFILLRNNQLEAAENLIDAHAAKGTITDEDQHIMREQLREAKRDAEKNKEVRKKELIKSTYGLSEYAILEQISIVESLEILTKKELISIANVVFNNPFLSQYIKALFLQTLIKNKYDQEIVIPVLDNQVKVNPATLYAFNQDDLVISLNHQLEKTLEREPSLLLMIKPEVNSHLLMIYPLIHDIITDVNDWIALYIDRYGQRAEFLKEKTESESQMKKWFDQLMHENT